MEKDPSDIYLKKGWLVQQKHDRIDKYYDIDSKRLLGQGQFGTALSMKVLGTDEYRAMKVISKQKVKNPAELIKEINILKTLDHPNVIKLYEIFEDQRNIYLVMEQCNGGELFDKIQSSGSLCEKTARNYFRNIMQGISYCHSQNICHRDLKPENFLLYSNEDDSQIKIIDFGLSCMYMQNDKRLDLTAKAGSAFYISPEVLNGQYTELCDIWSLGVILFIMLSGLPPFFGKNDQAIFEMIKTMKYNMKIPQFANVSDKAKDLISKCLVPEKDRLTAAQALEHPWLKENLPELNLNLDFQALRQFTNSQKLKKVALTLIASQMSEKEIKDLGELFKKIDLNNDGVISFDEMQTSLGSQLEENQIKQLKECFESIDTNSSGFIDYNEFIAASMDQSMYLMKDKLFLSFKMLDANGNGKIDKAELKKALSKDSSFNKFSEEYWDDLMKSADKNGDGEIDYNEFVELLKN